MPLQTLWRVPKKGIQRVIKALNMAAAALATVVSTASLVAVDVDFVEDYARKKTVSFQVIWTLLMVTRTIQDAFGVTCFGSHLSEAQLAG